MTENIQLQPTPIPPFRPPLSVLAVRPKTKAPPPLPVPTRSPAYPTVPKRGILPVPTVPTVQTLMVPRLTQPNIVTSPSVVKMRPTSPSVVKMRPTSPSVTQLSTIQAFNVEREGKLLPIIPIPYEPVFIVQQGTSTKTIPNTPESMSKLQTKGSEMRPTSPTSGLVPGLRVVVPTVSESYVPKVVKGIEPRSPPQSPPPQSLIRGQIIASAPPNLPTSPVYRQPAIMTGSNPPIGEEEPVTNFALSRQGLIANSTPVDVAPFSISQEAATLPVEQSLQPPILSSQIVATPIPSSGSIPYSLDEIIAPNPASPSLRSQPLSNGGQSQQPVNQSVRSPRLITQYPLKASAPIIINPITQYPLKASAPIIINPITIIPTATRVM